MFNFDNSYTTLPEHLFTSLDPIPVISPDINLVNETLAKELGINTDSFLQHLSGNETPAGSAPIAQAYAGHQFGHLNILGDGRAILLGEHLTADGKRFDIQLKGSGRTPYSRGGDGRATLYSMLREYVISEAMANLGIPTTRSLAVLTTGEKVYRETPQDGAILTRIASSHIRVGTFVYVALKSSKDELKEFADYVISRHYPEITEHSNQYVSLLSKVMDNQIDLVVNWMRVGFIHGVMNTDNVSISGETIDYGPCAFMDHYDPQTVFSSIDRFGRYSFENQEGIAGWNLTRFAETLIPIVHDEDEIALNLVNEILDTYNEKFKEKYDAMMAAKIGITNPTVYDTELVSELLNTMKENKLDYTETFRNLPSSEIYELELWKDKWRERNVDLDLMNRTNPVVIPRNHIVEEALTEASEQNNQLPLQKLLDVLKNPYSESASDYFTRAPETVDACYKTYCGT